MDLTKPGVRYLLQHQTRSP